MKFLFQILAVSFWILCGEVVWAQEMPALLKKVQTKYSTVKSLMAIFDQVNESKTFKTSKKSAGVLSIKMPQKMRWETQKPDPSIFISDGKSFLFYTPPFDEGESGQLVIKKASDYQSQLATSLLSGNFKLGKELKIKEKKPGVFVLTPKKGTSGDVSLAEVYINAQSLLIEKINLIHENGNRSEVSLSQIKLDPVMDDSLFTFQPPVKTIIHRE